MVFPLPGAHAESCEDVVHAMNQPLHPGIAAAAVTDLPSRRFLPGDIAPGRAPDAPSSRRFHDDAELPHLREKTDP